MGQVDRVRIRLLWLKQAQFAGYLMAEHLGLGRERGVEIVCEAADPTHSPIEVLLSGAADFCVASPAHALESRAPGALRWLLTVQQVSPLVYPVRAASGVEGLGDLAGRSIAVWPGGEDLELRWMLTRAGLAPGAVERLEALDTVTPFVADEVACAQMTIYHELREAEARLKGEALRLFSGDAVGCSLVKDGLMTSRALVEERQEMVQAVVDAALEGWTLAFDEPERAVDVCARARPEVSRCHHAAQLADIRALALGGATRRDGLGVPDPAHLDGAARAIREVEGRAVETTGIRDDRFFRRAPAPFRRAAW